MTPQDRIQDAVYQLCAVAERADASLVTAQAALDDAKQNAIDARAAAKQISDALNVNLTAVIAEVAASANT